MTARRDVLAIVEASGSGVPVAALEVLGLARQVADALGGTVHACVLGSGLEGIGAELVAHGADRVHGDQVFVRSRAADRYVAFTAADEAALHESFVRYERERFWDL